MLRKYDKMTGGGMRAPFLKLALAVMALLMLLSCLGRADAQQVAPAARPALQFPPVQFVTALCRDLAGNIWIGSEDQGVWSFNPATGQSKQYLPKDGLGDEHCYALACDGQGRIWAGHQSHGVSVFNGQKWQNYEVVGGLSRPDSLSGPLGERIFDIKVCPKDGDVWIATSLGLSRYSVTTGQWSYITRMDGLPSDQIQCLAFEKDGTLWAGTQCDGLAVAKPPFYKSWKQTTGPDKLPLIPAGAGLPSNLINDLLVGRDGTVWVATTTGLTFSRDRGRSFRFVRGADWSDKVKGSYGGEPKDWQPADAPTLTEDYITCLAEDSSNRLWVGHRQQPYEVLDARDGRQIHQGEQKYAVGKALKDQDHYITRILPLLASDAPIPAILGRYGFGLVGSSFAEAANTLGRRPPVTAPQESELPAVAAGQAPLLPLGAAPYSQAGLEALTAWATASGGKRLAQGEAMLLSEDWMTKGDWVGRYGRQYSILCAADSPLNHYVAFGIGYKVEGLIGPHADKGDSLRHWVQWDKTDNPNTLWDPCVGTRRQAEWDDHGEGYPISKEGPDLWAIVEVPQGVHQVALYFFNKDGHAGSNRWRDYTVEVKRWAADYEAVDRSPALARARVKDFWGGNYKVFAVNGPGKFLVKVGRNYSFNTILSAVLVDRLTGKHTGLNEKLYARAMPWMGDLRYDAPAWEHPTRPGSWGEALWLASDPMSDSSRQLASARPVRLLAYRQALSTHQPEAAMLANWRWSARLWLPPDRDSFKQTMASAWERAKQLTLQLIRSE